MIRSLTSVSLLVLPLLAFAHSEEQHQHGEATDNKITVGAAASIGWNSTGAADSNGLWRIPGALMGGHALPAQKGGRVDDATLWGNYRLNERTQFNAAVGVHNDGSTKLELENLSVDYQLPTRKPVTLSAGMLEPEFSPSAHHHPSTDTFADSTLMADAFWGRSIHDKGVRLTGKPTEHTEVGVEAWNGDFSPAKSGDGAQDVYAKFERTTPKGWAFNGGAWVMQAQASNRSDDRYFDGGHTHASATTTLPVDVKFSGDTTLAGSWLDVAATTKHGIQTGLRYEAAQTQSSGKLFDATHQANYDSDHLAYAVTPRVTYGKLQLSYRLEKLSLENKLTGNGAQILGEEANLITAANPKRQTMQATWQINRHFAGRVAYTKDNTLAEADDRVSVGLVWQDTLYKK